MEDFGDPNSRDGGTRFFRQAVSADAFPVFSHYVILRDGYHHLKYIGESMVGVKFVIGESSHLTDIRKVSRMFEDTFGQLYKPAESWTSSLRSRAGLPTFQDDDSPASICDICTPSPFTFTGKDLSRAVWKLLSDAFLEHPSRVGVNLDTTYHFEVGMILDEYDGRFSWKYSDIERVRISFPSCSKFEIPFVFPGSLHFRLGIIISCTAVFCEMVRSWSRLKSTSGPYKYSARVIANVIHWLICMIHQT